MAAKRRDRGKDMSVINLAYAPKAFIIFNVKGLPFACDLDHAKEVLSAKDIYPLPNARREVVGVKNLRGEVVPIFDLEEILYPGEGRDHRDRKVLIVKSDDVEFGLTVDKIDRIENYDPERHSISGLKGGETTSSFAEVALLVDNSCPIPILEMDTMASYLEGAMEEITPSLPDSGEDS